MTSMFKWMTGIIYMLPLLATLTVAPLTTRFASAAATTWPVSA